jgi:hypothetical protein
MINNLVERLSVRLRQPWMRSGAFVVVSFIATIPFFWLAGLPSPQAGVPGLALEFPGTANTALAILRAFADADLLGSVRKAIYWDFLLIPIYVIAFVSLLEWLPRGEHGCRDELLGYAIQGALYAGALDFAEDLGMLFLLGQVSTPEHPLFGLAALLTTLFALFKWTLLVAIGGYSAWELAMRMKRRMRSGSTREISSA